MRGSIYALSAMLALSACSQGDGEGAPAPEEVETGGAWFHTPSGPVWLTFEIIDGHAIFEGDIDFGPLDELYARGRGGAATTNLGLRWTNSVVPYWINTTTMTQANADTITASLQRMEAVTPLDFVPQSSPPSGPYIQFVRNDGLPNGVSGRSDMIGMAGGGQTIFLNGTSGSSGFNDFTIHHEVGHALGLWHEQSRSDRSPYIQINWNCIAQSDQYAAQSTENFGPYDYNSIMHYNASAGCAQDANGNCLCATMTALMGSPPPTVGGNGALTAEDINTLYRMYATSTSTNLADERFGRAVAIGDFDGDGYGDVAIGVPGQDASSGENDAGMVKVLKGTSARLVPWQKLVQGMTTGDDGVNDRFGEALAAGDFDNDGFDDLAIGVPHEDYAGVFDTGAVFVFRGSPEGLGNGFWMTQSSTGAGTEETGDLFGFALAAGDFNADGIDDLAVGAPLERGGLYTGIRSGAVFVFKGANGAAALTTVQKYTKPLGIMATGDRFGFSLAAGNMDTDNDDDLVVGAPETGNSGAGAVYVFRGRTTGTALVEYEFELRQPSSASPFVDTDDFGWSVAIGNFEEDDEDQGGVVIGEEDMGDVAVGAPGKTSRQGRVYVYEGAGGSVLPGSHTYVKTLRQSPMGADEAGDEFGYALAAGDLDGTGASMVHLLVGVPGEDSGGTSTNGRGCVFLYGSNDVVGLYQSDFWKQDDLGWFSEPGDRFGESIAIGGIYTGPSPSTASPASPSHKDFVVGASGEAPDIYYGAGWLQDPSAAGAIYMFRGTINAPDGMYHQESIELE